jgi:hypothetical protein
VAAAADVFIAGIEGELVVGLDRIAGFAGGLGIDADLSGEDGAFGAFAAFAKAAFNQGLIKASHMEMNLLSFLSHALAGSSPNRQGHFLAAEIKIRGHQHLRPTSNL